MGQLLKKVYFMNYFIKQEVKKWKSAKKYNELEKSVFGLVKVWPMAEKKERTEIEHYLDNSISICTLYLKLHKDFNKKEISKIQNTVFTLKYAKNQILLLKNEN